MEITYFGHSCFKLKGQRGTVVCDPYSAKIGLELPTLSADIITLSHDHYDHSATESVKGTSRRSSPFIVSEAGEYEVGGISVFGLPSFHDESQGTVRGSNIIFTTFMDELHICHLGDLGHELSESQIEDIGSVDVLFCPVGGELTVNPAMALKVIYSIEPSIIIPMHYRTPQHDSSFAALSTVEDFCKVYGSTPVAQDKLIVEKSRLSEETQLVVLTPETKDSK